MSDCDCSEQIEMINQKLDALANLHYAFWHGVKAAYGDMPNIEVVSDDDQ